MDETQLSLPELLAHSGLQLRVELVAAAVVRAGGCRVMSRADVLVCWCAAYCLVVWHRVLLERQYH